MTKRKQVKSESYVAPIANISRNVANTSSGWI